LSSFQKNFGSTGAGLLETKVFGVVESADALSIGIITNLIHLIDTLEVIFPPNVKE